MPVDVGGIIASEVLELNVSWTILNIMDGPTPAASDGNVLLRAQNPTCHELTDRLNEVPSVNFPAVTNLYLNEGCRAWSGAGK